MLRAKFNLQQSNFLDFYYTQTSECIKKYYNMEEIFLIIQQSLEQMPNSDNGESPDEVATSSPGSVSSLLAKRMEKAGFQPSQGKMKMLYRIYAVKNKNKKMFKAEEKSKGGVSTGAVEKRKNSVKDDNSSRIRSSSGGKKFTFDNLSFLSEAVSDERRHGNEAEDDEVSEGLQKKPVATNFTINSLLKSD